MLHRSCVALLSFLAVASVDVVSGSGSDVREAATADHILHLQPPDNTAHDIEASLAAIMKAEREKRHVSDSEFEVAKQRMINVEKQRIHDMVRNAFGALA